MVDVAVVTVGGGNGLVRALREAAAAAGLSVVVIDARAGLPPFDARPAARDEPEVADLRAVCARARSFVLALPAGAGGRTGSLLNLLQLLGGAAYDAPGTGLPLSGRRAAVRVEGAGPRGVLALEQLEAAVTALGGAVVDAALSGTPGARSADDLLAALAGGPDVRPLPRPVDLGLGHVHLPPPAAVAGAVRRAAGDVSLYAPRAGLPQLRRALAHSLGLHDPREVVVTAGASGGLSAALATLAEPGAGVLVPDPGFPNYAGIVAARGLRAIPYTLAPERGYAPDPGEIAALAPRARAILWNSPHNPTGMVAAPALVRQVVEIAEEHDLLVLSDEVYADLVWEGEHLSPRDAGGVGRTVVVRSFSKIFAMAGHRVGCAVAPPALAEEIRALHWAEHMSPPTLGQQAAAAALDAFDEILAALRGTLAASREVATARLAATGLLPHPPPGAFYLWLDVRGTGLDGSAYAAALAREEAVTVMPGEHFGAAGAGHVRVSFAAAPAGVEDGCRRLAAFHERAVARAAGVPGGPARSGRATA